MDVMIKMEEGHYVVRAADTEIKQRFFEWASFGEDPEYYGRCVDPREVPEGTVLRGEAAQEWALKSTDDYLYEWRLDDYKVRKLLGLWQHQLQGECGPKEVDSLKRLIDAFAAMLS